MKNLHQFDFDSNVKESRNSSVRTTCNKMFFALIKQDSAKDFMKKVNKRKTYVTLRSLSFKLCSAETARIRV